MLNDNVVVRIYDEVGLEFKQFRRILGPSPANRTCRKRNAVNRLIGGHRVNDPCANSVCRGQTMKPLSPIARRKIDRTPNQYSSILVVSRNPRPIFTRSSSHRNKSRSADVNRGSMSES